MGDQRKNREQQQKMDQNAGYVEDQETTQPRKKQNSK
jgi:hypothetical protein